MATKTQQKKREEAIAALREMVQPGDTVRTILRHVSRSGMSRSISPIIDCEDCSHLVARALGEREDDVHGGIRIGGAGMDMGFHLVNSLSYALYPEYLCTGRDGYGADRCPSSAHVNPPRPKPDGKMIHRDGYAIRHRWL